MYARNAYKHDCCFRLRLHAFSKKSDDVTATADAGLQVDDYYQDGGDQQQVRVDLQQLPDVYNDEKFHVIHAGLEKNLSLANYIVLVMTSYGHR